MGYFEAFVSTLNLLFLDADVARHYAQIRRTLRAQVARNLGHYQRIPGLQLYQAP